MSLDWSSQTGAGSLYGNDGRGGGVEGGGGIMGPPLVPKSTLIDDTKEYKADKITSWWKRFFCQW